MPGGTLDPTTIPKYVTPLVTPPVLYDDRGGQSPLDMQVSLRQFTQQILPPTDTKGAPLPPTPLWGYGDPTEPVSYFNPSFTMWLPAAGNIDCAGVGPDRPNVPNYACNGTFFESAEGADTANALGEGYAIDLYSNDQPTTTLWYHDHSLGITRLNVYAGGAGFWLIRGADDGESGLDSGTLPGPAPQKGDDPNCFAVDNPGMGMGGGKGPGPKCVRGQIREIPLAIQPKSFNADGTQFYPANRAFFEGLGDGQTYDQNADDGLNIPFLPQGASDIAPVWNPEAFFNTMVVNGKTWPQLAVASERYRFRVLNAADSRFLNLALFVVDADGSLGQEIPFYQIGAEQGLLPSVVRIETGFATPLPGGGADVGSGVTPVPGTFDEQALLVGPAERADVIVDFTGLANGTFVRMINTAPDAPFGGFPDVPADPGTTGQVMQFVVDTAQNTAGGDPSTAPKDLSLDDDPGGVAKIEDDQVDNVQDLALLEEESALICVTIDAVTGVIDQVEDSVPPDCDGGGAPFGPKAAVLGVDGSGGGEVQLWDDPIAQNPGVGDVEEWELWNWSADAHPIHLHLVKFQVVNREIIGGAVRGPEPWEAGWKDTVIAYPGEVTRVRALFDIAGLYVWHCHILSHEDNEMMVPYCVGELGVDCPDI